MIRYNETEAYRVLLSVNFYHLSLLSLRSTIIQFLLSVNSRVVPNDCYSTFEHENETIKT